MDDNKKQQQDEKNKKSDEEDEEWNELLKSLPEGLPTQDIESLKKVFQFVSKKNDKKSLFFRLKDAFLDILKKFLIYIFVYTAIIGFFRKGFWFSQISCEIIFIIVLSLYQSIGKCLFSYFNYKIQIYGYGIFIILSFILLSIICNYVNFISVGMWSLFFVYYLTEFFVSLFNYYIMKYKINNIIN